MINKVLTEMIIMGAIIIVMMMNSNQQCRVRRRGKEEKIVNLDLIMKNQRIMKDTHSKTQMMKL